MDKYTKFILTVIAVGIIGINFQLFGGDIISKAEASHQTIRWNTISIFGLITGLAVAIRVL